MRFGKKLALQVLDDSSGAPYVSHKMMKEAINRTVRELRMYQSRLQELKVESIPAPSDLAKLPEPARRELEAFEASISSLDRELFSLVDEDLQRLLRHVRIEEARLVEIVAEVQADALEACVLVDDTRRKCLEDILPVRVDDPAVFAARVLDFMIECDSCGTAEKLTALTEKHRVLVEQTDLHTQYLEINVAGFRKLLKRHEKQIPRKFCARSMPFLGFHRLVTHTTRQLMDIAQQLGAVLSDAWQRLDIRKPMRTETPRAAVAVPKSLGLECAMVLKIQLQLRLTMGDPLADVSKAPLGQLYPKPSLGDYPPSSGSSKQQAHPYAFSEQSPDLDSWWANILVQNVSGRQGR